MNRYDLYIGKEIMCCCGINCGKYYEVVSDVYDDKDGYEVFDIKDKDGCINNVYVDYINEYTEY